jgi:hypothetical protein
MLCTITALRRELEQPLEGEVVSDFTAPQADDRVLRDAIFAATDLIEKHCRRRFVPFVVTLRLDRTHVRGRRLMSRQDILEVFSVTNGDGTTVSSADYVLYPDDGITVPYGVEVFGTYWAFPEPRSRVAVRALLGYHEGWAQAFVTSGLTLPSNMTTTTTTLTFTSRIEVFEVGMLLRLEDELVLVEAIDAEAETVTVQRGVCGSVAASHASAVDIRIFRPMPVVQRAATRIALWYYQHRDAATGTIQFLDTGVTLSDRTISDVLRSVDSVIRKAFLIV